MGELSRAMLEKRHAILDWMDRQRKPDDLAPPPVLLSDMQRELGDDFYMAAFEGLRNDGVIRAEFPEAKEGDSGRQFWNFAHLTAEAPMTQGEEKGR